MDNKIKKYLTDIKVGIISIDEHLQYIQKELKTFVI